MKGLAITAIIMSGVSIAAGATVGIMLATAGGRAIIRNVIAKP